MQVYSFAHAPSGDAAEQCHDADMPGLDAGDRVQRQNADKRDTNQDETAPSDDGRAAISPG